MGETPDEPRKKTEHGTFQAGREAKLGREGGLHSTDAREEGGEGGGIPRAKNRQSSEEGAKGNLQLRDDAGRLQK